MFSCVYICAPCVCTALGGQSRAEKSLCLELMDGYQCYKSCGRVISALSC